ncbi:MAG: hypothetical protein BWY15_01112 [Firmicutes bacterium ADurb.Bin193]|nr:MAG: hypothetical protein BWY15_01112 [Firmicutes bacterium ADurb.Bin193]
MTVAVTSNLTTIAAQLRDLGYDVVTYGAYNYPIDAIVYSGEALSEANVTTANVSSSAGVLMINAKNKTIKQIDNSLKNRVYSPLF